ncbi:protein Iojap-related, mitochondrial [Sesamum angolense]|uniref:Protein Iojap-related, mitochondrial n=1 Tax=Sesamum angolense TaxID=2727404 RepID=A0AAE2BYR9_9LAMI|nr:protein Iojap-related, mitochondrial [Sesamum angolense]
MWSALRCRVLSSSSSPITHQWKNLLASSSSSSSSSSCSIFAREFTSSAVSINETGKSKELLSLAEVEKILNDVGADDVRVIPTPKGCEFTDYMVIATGRSPWHVKQKQKGAKRMLLPSVVGQEGGKWIVIDSGTLIVHAVDEKARAYYNFEGLWTTNISNIERTQDLEQAFVKIRRKNNSKKPSQAHA